MDHNKLTIELRLLQNIEKGQIEKKAAHSNLNQIFAKKETKVKVNN